jgi:hypothetical protein
VVCLLALVMASTSARAAAPTGADEALAAEARKHYEEGTKAFNLAEFPRAIAEFKAAYNAKPDPLLLFNIAQAFRLGGDDAQALLFYKSFLRNMPDAPNRKEVEARIRTLEKAVAEQQRQAEQLKKDAAAATVPPAVGSTAIPAAPAAPPDGRSGSGTATTTGVATGTTIDLRPPAPPPAAGSAPPALVPPPLATGSGSSSLAGTGTESAPTGPGVPVDGGRDNTTGGTPFYRRTWFWIAVGAAGAAFVVTVAAAGNADKQPKTPLGLYAPTFK